MVSATQLLGPLITMPRRVQCASLSCVFTQDCIQDTSLHLVVMSPCRIRIVVNFQSHQSDPSVPSEIPQVGQGSAEYPHLSEALRLFIQSVGIFFFFLIYLFIYLFIFGCVGSSFLCEGFL